MNDAKDHVKKLLTDAQDLAKSCLKLRGEGAADAMVIVEVAKLLHDAGKKHGEKKVFPGGTASTRPDPVQEARKTPRVPLTVKAETPKAKKPAARKR